MAYLSTWDRCWNIILPHFLKKSFSCSVSSRSFEFILGGLLDSIALARVTFVRGRGLDLTFPYALLLLFSIMYLMEHWAYLRFAHATFAFKVSSSFSRWSSGLLLSLKIYFQSRSISCLVNLARHQVGPSCSSFLI